MLFSRGSTSRLLGESSLSSRNTTDLMNISPKCKARVWRSAYEASIDVIDESSRRLAERREKRRPCQCSPEDRPQDK